MLKLSKDNSMAIKGIVIMMMVFYHLFNGKHMFLYTGLVHIGKVPLATWMAAACWPVSLFLILSGYGLAYKYEHGGIEPRPQLRRISRLYLHYWVVLALFVTCGHFLKPADYPGSFGRLVENMLGWNVNYDGEMWFLLPYCVISLFSLYIIRLITRLGNLLSVIITTGIFLCTSLTISHFAKFLYGHMIVYQPLLCFHLLQAFTMGVVLRRTSQRLNFQLPQWVVLAATGALFLTTCMIPNSITYLVYSPLLIILLGNVRWSGWVKTVLSELGKKSMTIWMIHTWLAYYLFQDQFYSLKYAPLIFIAVLGASYLISIPVMMLAGRIHRLIPFNSK